MIKSLWLKMGPSFNLLYPAYSDRRGIEHHAAILDALRNRRVGEARAALQADLLDGRAEVLRALRTHTESKVPAPAPTN
jgi:DNA-binding GntR family transcriptional regulator